MVDSVQILQAGDSLLLLLQGSLLEGQRVSVCSQAWRSCLLCIAYTGSTWPESGGVVSGSETLSSM